MSISRRQILLAAAATPLVSLVPAGPARAQGNDIRVRRLGPVITPAMLPGSVGGNIAGPSAVADRSGVRLYFADHKGTYIRLANANRPTGPYSVYAPGALSLDTVIAEADRVADPIPPTYPYAHIASPDVHRLPSGLLRMYFHAAPNDPYIPWNHQNGVAISRDGVEWHLENRQALQDTYLRAFRWRGEWFGVNREGVLSHSLDGVHWDIDEVPEFADAVNEGAQYIRHVALALDGDILTVYYSRIGDAPERIMLATCTLRGRWQDWRLANPIEVLRPEEVYEGADLPVLPSKSGSATEPGNELRDPAILDHRGRRYLFYSYRAEGGIGVAEID